jgi:hypothetical protein
LKAGELLWIGMSFDYFIESQNLLLIKVLFPVVKSLDFVFRNHVSVDSITISRQNLVSLVFSPTRISNISHPHLVVLPVQ